MKEEDVLDEGMVKPEEPVPEPKPPSPGCAIAVVLLLLAYILHYVLTQFNG